MFVELPVSYETQGMEDDEEYGDDYADGDFEDDDVRRPRMPSPACPS